MSTRKALFYSSLDRYSGLVISFGSSIVTARRLDLADLGVRSVAMTLLRLAATRWAPGASLQAVVTAFLGSALSLLLCLKVFRHPLGDELSGLLRRR